MTTETEKPKESNLEESVKNMPREIKRFQKGEQLFRDKKVPTSIRNYVEFALHFQEYYGFICALSKVGLKEEEIINNCKRKFQEERIEKEYFIVRKAVLENVVERHKFVHYEVMDKYKLLLKAYDAYLAEQNLKEKK